MNNEPTITKVEPLRVEIARPKSEPIKVRELQPLEEGTYWRSDAQDLTTWERLRHYGKFGSMTIGLVPKLFNIIRGLTMKDYKTTITGVVGALALIVGTFTGLHIGPEVQTAIVALTVAAIGWFASDSNKD